MSSSKVHSDEPSSKIPPAPPVRIVVKFKHSNFDYVDGAESHFSGRSAEDWEKIRHRFPGISLLRLFPSVAADRIDELVRRAKEIDRTYKAVDFKTYYVVNVPSGKNPVDLTGALSELPDVERVYVESPPNAPPAITLEPLSATQHYLNAAP